MPTSIYEARHVPLDSDEIYHDELDHDSSSSLRLFKSEPARYDLERVSRKLPRRKPSTPMKFGTLDHCTILERDRLDELVKVVPPEMLTSDGKAGVTKAYKQWRFENPGFKCYPTQKQFDASLIKSDRVHAHPDAAKLLKLAELREYAIFWRYDGVYPFKCKLDLGSALHGFIGDVKNCAEPFGYFHRAIERYGLLQQAAAYTKGYEALFGTVPEFWYIVCHGFEVSVKRLSPEDIELGHRLNAETLAKLYACKRGERLWLIDEPDGNQELILPENTRQRIADGVALEPIQDDYDQEGSEYGAQRY